jgi:hypothetical protein
MIVIHVCRISLSSLVAPRGSSQDYVSAYQKACHYNDMPSQGDILVKCQKQAFSFNSIKGKRDTCIKHEKNFFL